MAIFSAGQNRARKRATISSENCATGRIFVGFDCDDDGLGIAVKKAGKHPFLFGSDFPHEVFDAAKCRQEIDELLERDDLPQEDKQAVLGANAVGFYRPAC